MEVPVIEAPVIEALLIKASLVDTNELVILAETNELKDPFTSIINYCFAGTSIPNSLLTTTLTLLPFSIPATKLRHSYSL